MSAHQALLTALVEKSQHLASLGLAPATGGNFSARIDGESFYITRSGVDKRALSHSDFLSCNLRGEPIDSDAKPSAETLVHAAIYRSDESVGSVLHTHSVPSTTLSRLETNSVCFRGYEMQKSIRNNASHEGVLELPIIENTQNMKLLHDHLVEHWEEYEGRFGFLLRGHGLYAWGADLFEANRHVEGF